MPLGFDRPTDALLRELSAVARRAVAFETAMVIKTNAPAETLPREQLGELLLVLKGLPLGTGEGGRLQLETADARLNEVRIEFFSLMDDGADDAGLMREVPLDDALSLLIAAVRTALSVANREAGRRDVPAEPIRSINRAKAESELVEASERGVDTMDALEGIRVAGRQMLDAASLRADVLLRRLNDVIGLVRQARVELQWKEIVTSWLRRLADAIARTPDGLRAAAGAIDTANDVLNPFYDQWRTFQDDIEKTVRGNISVFTSNLRLAADRLERRRSNETVLFVDDEEPARVFAAHSLNTAYRNVETAESGADALALARTKKFDILITDVVMPDMGGLALASAFRKLDGEIAVLLVSGYAEAAIQREIKHNGYNFLAKPYSLDDLNKAVERTLAKSGAVPTDPPT